MALPIDSTSNPNGINLPQLLTAFKQSREITGNLWKNLTLTSSLSEYSAAWLKTVEVLLSNQLSAGITNRKFWAPYKTDLQMHRDLAFKKDQPWTAKQVEELRVEVIELEKNIEDLEDLNDGDPQAENVLRRIKRKLTTKKLLLEEQSRHRRYFVILHDKLKIIKQIQDLSLQELFLAIPKIPGSYLDDLPKDSNQVDIATILSGSKSVIEPSMNTPTTNMVTLDELSELTGVKEEFHFITADWESTFLKLENFLEMGNLVFNKQSDLSIKNERGHLLNSMNKENIMKQNSHTFVQWWHSIEPKLNRWNNSENKITIEEKVLFIVNNVGHIPRFTQLTLEYSKNLIFLNYNYMKLLDYLWILMNITGHPSQAIYGSLWRSAIFNNNPFRR
jgi:hypothetical protein